jgi:flavorubredoxin
MERSYSPAEGIHVLPTYAPIPGYGILPVNAFVLKSEEPVLIDCGLVSEQHEFMATLRGVIDPQELKWLWLTHTDHDHIGSFYQLLEEVPHLRVATTYLGAGKMSLSSPLPMDRLYFLNPGQSIDVGDRRPTAVQPPSFDAPETIGFIDSKSGALFSSDCFGAILCSPAEDARDIPEKELADLGTVWATIDAPWLHNIGRSRFSRTLNRIRELSPSMVLSSHLPAATGMATQLLKSLASVPDARPFVGPDQEALQQMLGQITHAA